MSDPLTPEAMLSALATIKAMPWKPRQDLAVCSPESYKLDVEMREHPERFENVRVEVYCDSVFVYATRKKKRWPWEPK